MINFVINTDLTITTEEVTKFFSEMENDDAGVGNALGLPQSKRDEVKNSHLSPAQRRNAYIDIYVNDHPFPTWSQVSQALRDVYLVHQANVVNTTYVQGTTIRVLLLWSSIIIVWLCVCQYLVYAPSYTFNMS